MDMRILLGALLALGAVPADAQDTSGLGPFARSLGISEIRAGVYLHDIELIQGYPFIVDSASVDFSKWQNVGGEVLFDLPDADLVRWLGSPRVGIGGVVNLTDKESYARLAAVWHIPVFETGLFVEPMLGGAVHNGYLSGAPAGQRNLGCRALYFYGANIGYEVSDSMTAMLSFEHASHQAQCGTVNNDGINRIGLRLGWKAE